MTRVATPENEEVLLAYAQDSTASQLERICRKMRHAANPLPDPSCDNTRRYVGAKNTDDGMVRITCMLHPEEAARVMTAIEAACSSKSAFDRPDGLVALADQALGSETRPVVEATLHVQIDADSLQGELDDGTRIPAETSKRLLCDAAIIDALHDTDGNLLSLGRKRRTLSTPLLRALKLRDPVCCFPGCDNRITDAHHLEHWCDGGETSLHNCICLCRKHHVYVHEHGFRVERNSKGDLCFFAPDGWQIPKEGEMAFRGHACYERMKRAMAKNGLEISAETNRPKWDGTPPDYGLAVASLCGVSASAASP